MEPCACKNTYFRKICYVIFIIFLIFIFSNVVYAKDKESFSGDGTIESPYLIENYQDLLKFCNMVNDGENFENQYFKQTSNIDMEYKKCEPIGNRWNRFFSGIYNGNGYYIENVNIRSSDEICALFGYLDGVVANLGIESGKIEGVIAAGIAGNAKSQNAQLLNCYNKAKILGKYVGGIAGNFNEGVISVCWNSGELNGEVIGGILPLGTDVKVYSCFSTNDILLPTNIVSTTSYSLTEEELFSKEIEKKLNVSTALSQYMYAKPIVNLKQWKNDENKNLVFDNKETYIKFIGLINDYFLIACILFVIVTVGFSIKKEHSNKNSGSSKRMYLKSVAIISGIIAIFCDTALLYKGLKYLNIFNSIFISLVNILFVFLLCYFLKDLKKLKLKKEWIPLGVLIIVVIILELLQFDLVPKYDACLYYGSFLRGIEEFKLDFITYIGAFVCWKWIQGLALIIAPFEFLLPGKMIGVYISNIFVTVISLVCLYWLLRQIYSSLSPLIATICCGIFIFFPYALGMFTYLCMDWHLPFFVIWLLCSIKKKNNYLICFSGYLLAFTKITGIVFYCGILLFVGVEEILRIQESNIIKKIFKWWDWKKVILWILPAVLFLVTYIYGDHITIQNFYGTYVSEQVISLNNREHVLNLILQTVGFGFRWLLVGLTVIACIVNIIWKKKNNLTKFDKDIIWSVIFASILTFMVLCLYNSDADCPRYTTIFNVFYVLCIPYVLNILFRKKYLSEFVGLLLIGVFFVQTYWTIDPMVKSVGESLNTGKIELYKLAMPNDSRSGMNLGEGYGTSQVLGDLYTYNLQHAFYDDLLEQALEEIQPTENDQFYVLDMIDYELHMAGSANKNYKIYWDQKSCSRTYDNSKESMIYLNETSLTTEQFEKDIHNLQLPPKFYLIVASRIDSDKAIKNIKEYGYHQISSIHPENIYGKLSVYGFEKRND